MECLQLRIAIISNINSFYWINLGMANYMWERSTTSMEDGSFILGELLNLPYIELSNYVAGDFLHLENLTKRRSQVPNIRYIHLIL